MIRNLLSFYFLFFLSVFLAQAQGTALGNQTLDEFLRRKLLTDTIANSTGWMLRTAYGSAEDLFYQSDSLSLEKKLFDYDILPIYSITRLDGKRPYVGGEYGMIPARGSQLFLSTGFQASFSILHIQLQPEFVTAQNLSFSGFPGSFPDSIITDRYFSWNIGDNPERFGNNAYKKAFWGQSSISIKAGSFQFEVGTKNFWWGPGQWNSLIFSNNAPGFPHIALNTIKPAKTFLGSFEGQLVVGRLESSNQAPSQIDSLNSNFFRKHGLPWRYFNGLLFSYNPNWISNLTVGYLRTFQYYNESRPKDFYGWLPVFEPMSKEKLFKNGNSVEYDDRSQSQQVSIFGRYKMVKAKAEIYFQFGRRDHALNWREFFLNPEHARAYQFGFIKLSKLSSTKKLLQFRGEVTHQQESINRIIRYDLFGFYSWHTHGLVRHGFSNYGQFMGVGIGTGSNVQTLEVSLVENWKKLGILFERLENNQDFYYRAFGQQGERKPWIDWSTALLWNTSYKDLFISARLQGTYAQNYQWGLSKTSTPEFPVSQNLFSLHSQVNLIYFWNRSLKKKD